MMARIGIGSRSLEIRGKYPIQDKMRIVIKWRKKD